MLRRILPLIALALLALPLAAHDRDDERWERRIWARERWERERRREERWEHGRYYRPRPYVVLERDSCVLPPPPVVLPLPRLHRPRLGVSLVLFP